MQISLLNTYSPRLIATILKAFREQFKENDQLNAVEAIAGPEPEIHLAYDQILKGGRFWDDVNGGSLPEDLVLVARREEIDWVFSVGEKEIVPMQECKDAGLRPLELIWVDTDKYVDPAHKKCRSKLCVKEYKTKKQGQILRILPASQLFSAMPLLEVVKVFVSIMMSVSRSNEGKPLKLRHYESAEHVSKEQFKDSFTSDFPQKIVRNKEKTKLADRSTSCMEFTMLPTSGNLIMLI